MNNKPAFKFKPNQPTSIKLKYNQPKTGTSTGKDGKTFPYFLYGAEINGQDETFFTTELLHNKIQQAQMVQNSIGIVFFSSVLDENGNANKEYKLKVNDQEIILDKTQNKQVQVPQAPIAIPQQSNQSLAEIFQVLQEIKTAFDNNTTEILRTINELNNKTVNLNDVIN